MNGDEIEKLDFERIVAKKIDRKCRYLPPHKRLLFIELKDDISRAVKWGRLTNHVKTSLGAGSPSNSRFNIYKLQEGINSVINKSFNWVKRNEVFSVEKVRDYKCGLITVSRSICRVVDSNATCWNSNVVERILNE